MPGTGPWGTLLMFATFALFLFGMFGRTAAPGTLVHTVDADGQPADRPPGPPWCSSCGPGRAWPRSSSSASERFPPWCSSARVANAAFVARYTAVVLPLFLLVVASGLAVIPGRRFRVGCIAVLCLAGLLTGRGENAQQRTQAAQVAAVLNAQAQPGDLVVYCPDQLGPAVDRLLTVSGVEEITFPRAIGPQRVDWVDYQPGHRRDRCRDLRAGRPGPARPGPTLWLVWSDGYPGLGGDCGYLKSWLDLLHTPGATIVHSNGRTYYEHENLVRYSG